MDKLIRLYRTHDLDLICLKADPSFRFNKKFKQAVCAYVRGEEFEIEIPPLQAGYSFKYLNTAFHLKFSERTEMDIINFLNSLRDGNGTGAMKAIFRSYFKGFRLEPFLYTSSKIKKVNNCPIMVVYKENEDVNDIENLNSIKKPQKKEKEQHSKNDVSKITKNETATVPIGAASQNIYESENINSGTNNDDISKNDKEQNGEFDLFSALDKMMAG